jgi:tetratricopeptide (TPR) repeat protein
MDDRRYWAFLSYSHADRAWARWFHRALEAYAVPRRLVGRPTPTGPTPRRLRPIFRDREDLAANPHLREGIIDALERSGWLIVICSPSAARSQWVNEEIVRFKALHGEDRVLAVIVSGEPNVWNRPGLEGEECFPPALRQAVGPDGALTDATVDLVAADVRPGKDGRRLARLKLLAGMLQVPLDELARRDAQARHMQLAALAAALGMVATVTTGLAITAWVERDEARAQRAQAEGLIEFMLGDLRKKLEPSARLDVLDAVGAKALSYYASEAPRGLDDDALGRRARVLHLLGDIRDQRGDLAGALRDFEEASRVTAALLAKKPDDGVRIFNHAQSVYYVGNVADRRGQAAEAEQAFEDYQRLANRLVQLDPGRDDWRAEVVYANENLGALWVHENRTDRATAAFSRALKADLALAAKAPTDRDRQTDLAGVYGWLADAEADQKAPGPAIRDRLSERAIYQRLLARQPGDNAVKLMLIHNGVALAAIYSQAGRLDDAVVELSQATEGAERLIAFQPDNTDYRAHAALAQTFYAKALLAKGDLAGANAAADRALELAVGLVRKDPTVVLWRGYLLGAARVVEIRIAAQNAHSPAAFREALRPADAEADRLLALATSERPDLGIARVTTDAMMLAGDYALLAGRPDLARARWASAAAVCICRGRAGGPPDPGRPAEALVSSRLADVAALNHRPVGAQTRERLADVKRRWLGGDIW